jgi:hypothetical protein
VQRGLRRAVDFSLEAYNNGWGEIVAEVQGWLVARPLRPLRLAQPPKPETGTTVAAELLDLPLQEEIKQLHKAAEAVLQPFAVRSGVPVLGPLIVWLRRNLTSHLREPYLDPTLRRQERFNWLVVQTMRQVNRLLEQPSAREAALEARVARLETQLENLLTFVTVQSDGASDAAGREDAEMHLRYQIDKLPPGDQTPSVGVPASALPSDESSHSP